MLDVFLPNLQEMFIGEGCLRNCKGDLVIENYLNLEKIIVKKNSLINLNSLKISNNIRLKMIEIEDGVRLPKNDKWYYNSAFRNVKNVIIQSI